MNHKHFNGQRKISKVASSPFNLFSTKTPIYLYQYSHGRKKCLKKYFVVKKKSIKFVTIKEEIRRGKWNDMKSKSFHSTIEISILEDEEAEDTIEVFSKMNFHVLYRP